MFINDFAAAGSSTTRRIELMIMLPIVIIFTILVLVCFVWYVQRYKKQNREGNGNAYPDALSSISVPT